MNVHGDNIIQKTTDQVISTTVQISPKEQQVLKLLEQFRSQHCPGVSAIKMNMLIAQGTKLEKQLVKLAKIVKSEEQWKEEIDQLNLASPDKAVALMWVLTKKAAGRGDLFTEGAMTIAGGEHLTGKMLEQFLHACGKNPDQTFDATNYRYTYDATNYTYSRISSHKGETLAKGDTQYGLDLRGKGLPSGKHHILFAAQPDGSVYIKLEEHGCPPFWKNGFQTLKNFKEFFDHAVSYVTTRPAISKTLKALHLTAEEKGPKLEAKKEHIPAELKKEYKDTLNFIFPPNKTSFFEYLGLKKTSNEKKAAELYAEGKTYGISNMLKNVSSMDTSNFTVDQLKKWSNMLYELAKQENRAKKGLDSIKDVELKGNEVIIPPLGSK